MAIINQNISFVEVNKLGNDMYHEVVQGKADDMIKKMTEAIQNLEGHWIGDAAKTRISELEETQHLLVSMRKVLAKLSEVASVIAKEAVEREIANGAKNVDSITPLTIDEGIGEYTANVNGDPTRTVIKADLAESAKTNVQNVDNSMDDFLEKAENYKKAILGAWVEGQVAGYNKDDLERDFNDCMTKFRERRSAISDAAKNIDVAINNYGQ